MPAVVVHISKQHRAEPVAVTLPCTQTGALLSNALKKAFPTWSQRCLPLSSLLQPTPSLGCSYQSIVLLSSRQTWLRCQDSWTQQPPCMHPSTPCALSHVKRQFAGAPRHGPTAAQAMPEKFSVTSVGEGLLLPGCAGDCNQAPSLFRVPRRVVSQG